MYSCIIICWYLTTARCLSLTFSHWLWTACCSVLSLPHQCSLPQRHRLRHEFAATTLLRSTALTRAWQGDVIRGGLMNATHQRTDPYHNWRHQRSVLTTRGHPRSPVVTDPRHQEINALKQLWKSLTSQVTWLLIETRTWRKNVSTLVHVALSRLVDFIDSDGAVSRHRFVSRQRLECLGLVLSCISPLSWSYHLVSDGRRSKVQDAQVMLAQL